MKHPIATFLLVTSGALLGSAALAQLPPPPGADPAPASPSPSPGGLLGGGGGKSSAGDVKSECNTSAKKAGLIGKELDDYVKQCVSKGGNK